MHFSRNDKNPAGFTLVELLVVIATATILAGIAIPLSRTMNQQHPADFKLSPAELKQEKLSSLENTVEPENKTIAPEMVKPAASTAPTHFTESAVPPPAAARPRAKTSDAAKPPESLETLLGLYIRNYDSLQISAEDSAGATLLLERKSLLSQILRIAQEPKTAGEVRPALARAHEQESGATDDLSTELLKLDPKLEIPAADIPMAP